MPIDLNKISSSLSGMTTRKAETSKTSEVTSVTDRGVGDSLSGSGHFSKGEVFHGQITNISPKEMTISLENGEILRAKYENCEDLSIGDDAKFKVIEKTNQLLMIKALTNPNGSIDHAVLKAFDASGLPFSEKNEELITALLKNELSVNRTMIHTILQQSLKNTDISMTNLVMMNKAGLPILPEITSLFEAYGNGEEGLLTNTEQSFQSLIAMLDGLTDNTSLSQASERMTEILTILKDGLSSHTANLPLFKDTISQAPPLPKKLEDFSSLLKETLDNHSKAKDFSLSDAKISDFWQGNELLTIFSFFENSDAEASSLQSLLSGEMTIADFSSLLSHLPETEKTAESLFPDFLKEFSMQYLGAEKNSLLRELLPPTTNAGETAEILSLLLSSDKISDIQRTSLLSSSYFRDLLSSLFKKAFSLSPEEISLKDEVPDFYRRMAQTIDKLIATDNSFGSFEKSFSSDLSALKQNLNFLNTMSHSFGFTELPLKLENQGATGDLYVFTDRKGGGNFQKDSISCLLHLDLTHLGALNVKIELNGSSVSTKFYLNEEENAALIRSHLSELDSAIQRQGFQPKSEVMRSNKKEPQTVLESGNYNLVRDFLPSEIEKNHFTRYTFDVRA